MKTSFILGNCSACKAPYVEISALEGENCYLLIDHLQKMIHCSIKSKCMDLPTYLRSHCDISHFIPILQAAK